MTFNHAAHKRLWDWLLRNPLKQEDNDIFFDDEPSLEPDDDYEYDRRIDDMLCGDE